MHNAALKADQTKPGLKILPGHPLDNKRVKWGGVPDVINFGGNPNLDPVTKARNIASMYPNRGNGKPWFDQPRPPGTLEKLGNRLDPGLKKVVDTGAAARQQVKGASAYLNQKLSTPVGPTPPVSDEEGSADDDPYGTLDAIVRDFEQELDIEGDGIDTNVNELKDYVDIINGLDIDERQRSSALKYLKELRGPGGRVGLEDVDYDFCVWRIR